MCSGTVSHFLCVFQVIKSSTSPSYALEGSAGLVPTALSGSYNFHTRVVQPSGLKGLGVTLGAEAVVCGSLQAQHPGPRSRKSAN